MERIKGRLKNQYAKPERLKEQSKQFFDTKEKMFPLPSPFPTNYQYLPFCGPGCCRWLSNKSSKYALGALPVGGKERLVWLSLALNCGAPPYGGPLPLAPLTAGPVGPISGDPGGEMPTFRPPYLDEMDCVCKCVCEVLAGPCIMTWLSLAPEA